MAPKPRALLLALGALTLFPGLCSSLVLAQSQTTTPPLEPTPAPAPQPQMPVSPPPPLPSPPVNSPVLRAPTSAAPAAPLIPGMEERRAESVRRYEDIEREAFTPAERAGRIRTHNFLSLPSAQRQEACVSGALSRQECSTGVVISGRGRAGASAGMDAGDLSNSSGAASSGYGYTPSGGFRTDASPLPPISVPISALLSGAGGSFRLTDVFGRTPRPAPIAGNGNLGLIFPLIGSAVTTSEFGYRLHPVMGTWLMHSGRDLAAPEGTPVVAALSGRVMSSGLAGGYGLAIELEHESPRRRTLYGHLSELYVREGQMVRQGEVIGRVGSTGLSTGPHLHFELRLPQEGGWVAVDPGQLDPGSMFPAGLAGQPGQPDAMPTDAVALLVGQLVQTLERPRSPLGNAAAAPVPSQAMPPHRNLPAPAPLPPRGQG